MSRAGTEHDCEQLPVVQQLGRRVSSGGCSRERNSIPRMISVTQKLALLFCVQHVVAVVYAIHKPRNVLSAVSDANPNRRTLTDVMVAAGVTPLPGHVGRLDAETSGLMLVTDDTLLLRAMLQWPEVVEAYGTVR